MEKYDPTEIEKKWQDKWAKEPDLTMASEASNKPKKYILDMFPYPSGAGLHVGHVESYTATDIYSRFLRMNGFNVLHPQGFDAFGLPAENYAVKTGVHPKITTEKAVETFKRQINAMGFSYDWSREVNSSHPQYYKWTQWLFLLLYKNGLAYKKKAKVNWCPNCQTVLANEQAEGGKCDRCGSDVIQKDLEQWFFKITDFIEDNGKTAGLLSGLGKIDWPESTKSLQRNWIGKSVGAQFQMKIEGDDANFIEVFTTRLDTVFGITYAVLAPEHKIIPVLKERIENWDEIEKYLQATSKKTDLDRMEAKEKTGVELKGVKVINPFNGEAVPLFAADYVLGHYGTGAVMAVPAHDERDWEFAKKYNLPIVQVIRKKEPPIRSFLMGRENISREDIDKIGVNIIEETDKKYLKLEIPKKSLKKYQELIREKMTPGFWNETVGENINFIFKSKEGDIKEFILDKNNSQEIEKLGAEYNDEPYLGEASTLKWLAENDFYTDLIIHIEDGLLVNSEKYSGMKSDEAREKMTTWLEKNKIGEKKVNYKLRDWLVSRQRYWGAPIPIIYCAKCGEVAVPEKDLPVELPDDVDFKPTGESPLKYSKKFQDVACPKCGGEARRESDTMDTFVCSSWYYLRYADSKNDKEFASKEKLEKWLPVDLYVGGAEHSVLHLLYSRFFTKVLHRLGYLNFDEPFLKLRHQGTILAEDGTKMSKSKGNVINPDDVIKQYGADSLRCFEMFMGPLEDAKPWQTKGIIGVYRFLEKVLRHFMEKNFGGSVLNAEYNDEQVYKIINKTIKKVSEDIENLKFNTSISELMQSLNSIKNLALNFTISEDARIYFVEKYLLILSPFAPHLAEELWKKLGHEESIFKEKWPEYDPKLIQDEEIELVIQVNGKVRDKITVAAEIKEEEAKEKALAREKIKSFLGGKEVKKAIYIKGRLINLVA